MSISTEIERIENAKTAIQNAKTAIRTAINAKGGVLTENQPMSEYAVAITALQTGESVDLSFVTATASDILAGKIGADTSGNPVNGTIQTVTASLTDNVVTVPQGFVASEQTLTVAEMSEPSVSRNVVTIAKGYNKSERITTVGTAKGAETITPGTADRTIAAGTYLTGALTVKGDADLVAENIAEGKEIFGIAGSFKGGSSMDFYKCAAVYGPEDVKAFRISGCPDTKYNGTYMPTELTTENGEGGKYPVYKHETSDLYYYFDTYAYFSWGLSPNYTRNLVYYGSGTSWEDNEYNVIEGMSCDEIWVTVKLDVPKTWDGHKAVKSGDIYTFEDTPTTGLTYSSVKPKRYSVYSDDASMVIRWLPQSFPTAGLILYAPLGSDIDIPEVGSGDISHDTSVELGTLNDKACAVFNSSGDGAVVNCDGSIGSGDFSMYTEFCLSQLRDSRICWLVSSNGSRYGFEVTGGNKVRFIYLTNTYEVEANRWYPVLCVRKNGKLSFYVNKSLVEVGNITNWFEAKVTIGENGFTGGIRNVMVYNRALSDAEIAQITSEFSDGGGADEPDSGGDTGGGDDKTYVYTVSGAGTESVNGDYYDSGLTMSNRTVYTNGNVYLGFNPNSSAWTFTTDPTFYNASLEYYGHMSSYDDPTASAYVAFAGTDPAPTVTEYSADSGDSGNVGGGDSGDSSDKDYRYTVSGCSNADVNGDYYLTDQTYNDKPVYSNGKVYLFTHYMSEACCDYVCFGTTLKFDGLFYIGGSTIPIGSKRWTSTSDYSEYPITIAEYVNVPEGESGNTIRVSGCPTAEVNGDYTLADMETDSGGPIYLQKNGDMCLYHLQDYWWLGVSYSEFPGSYYCHDNHDANTPPISTAWYNTNMEPVSGMKTEWV